MVAMIRPCRVILVHRCLRGDVRVRGRSIAVGIRTFSIVGG